MRLEFLAVTEISGALKTTDGDHKDRPFYDNVKGGDIDLYLQTPDDSAAAEKILNI